MTKLSTDTTEVAGGQLSACSLHFTDDLLSGGHLSDPRSGILTKSDELWVCAVAVLHAENDEVKKDWCTLQCSFSC